ncbi:MAG: nucleoside-diphosphate sugar epimerase/dehydratase [Pseudomonadota bacterium]
MLLSFITSLSRARKRAVIVGLDLVIIPVAFAFCYVMQSMDLPLHVYASQVLWVLPYLCMAAVGLSFWFELPQIRLKNFEGRAVLRYAAYSASLALVLVPLAAVFGASWHPSTYVLFGLSYCAMGTIMRFAMCAILVELYRRAAPRRRVLIYGAGNTGTELAAALRMHHSIDPVAFVDDNASLHRLIIAGLPVYSPAQLQRIVEDRAIDRVLLAIPSLSPPRQMQIARRLQALGLEVQLLPSFSQLVGDQELLDKFIKVPPRDLLPRDEVAGPLGENAACYRGKSVLVSGAGGSIGSELCRQLLECRPSRLILLELSEYALYTADLELRQLCETSPEYAKDVEIVPILGSATDGRLVRKLLADYEVQIVLHAAAYKHVPLVEINQLAGFGNNILGTQTLSRESYDAGVERFILISSDKAVRPKSVMGASKRFAELVVQDLAKRVPAGDGPRYSMVRFGNVLGSSGSVVPLFQEQIARGGPVTVTHRDVTRYFMTMQEAARLVLTAGAMAEGGEIYVLDMGKPVSISTLARQTIEAAGYTVRDADNPEGDIEIEYTGLRSGEKLHEELTITSHHNKTDHPKIFSVREEGLSEIEIARTLRALREAVAGQDVDGARAAIGRAVLEYEPEGQSDLALSGTDGSN